MWTDGFITHLLLAAVISFLCNGDPCTDTTIIKTLTGQTWRSSAYSEANLANAKCDAAIDEGWYRIDSEAGNDTVTECVPTFRCGTYFPVWMNGSLPDVSEGIVVREMCVSHYLGCCYITFNMSVQNCGDFRVYNLKQTSACAVAYCFGTILVTTVAPPTTTTITTTTTEQKKGQNNKKQAGNWDKYSELEGKEVMILIIIMGLVVIVVGVVAVLIFLHASRRKITVSIVTSCQSNSNGNWADPCSPQSKSEMPPVG